MGFVRKNIAGLLCFRRQRRREDKVRHNAASLCGLAAFCLAVFVFAAAFAEKGQARVWFGSGETRSLKIYFVHTGEREEVVFKKNGRYVRRGLQRLDYLLRDWRRNEAAHMAPNLFDLLWQIYQLSGSKDYFHVVSGYRSPQTNAMLRRGVLGSAVAKHSRHMEGKAVDFYLPDVNLAYLRAIALKLQGGGIGYYPVSGSPFVHVDVGSVRHWPRMSRPALAALFPDGKSLHVPSDGRPLSAYGLAAAEYRQRSASAIPVYSPRALFGNMSARQIVLAAADGRLPVGREGRLRGMADLPLFAEPSLRARADPPVYAQPAPQQVPIPFERELLFAAEPEQAEDEADVKMSPVPVPHFKYEARDNDEIGALLAYAPVNAGAPAAVRVLEEFLPVPEAKPQLSAALAEANAADLTSSLPAESAGVSGAAATDRTVTASIISERASFILPLPRPKPQFAGNDTIAAVIIANKAAAPRFVPRPVPKKSGR